MKKAVVDTEAGAFVLYEADLEHIDNAIVALRKSNQFTASDRLGVVRDFVDHFLVDPNA